MAQRADEADMPQESSSASRTGPDERADMVYRMMMRDLELEKERRP